MDISLLVRDIGFRFLKEIAMRLNKGVIGSLANVLDNLAVGFFFLAIMGYLSVLKVGLLWEILLCIFGVFLTLLGFFLRGLKGSDK
jgi:hypothetical protein